MRPAPFAHLSPRERQITDLLYQHGRLTAAAPLDASAGELTAVVMRAALLKDGSVGELTVMGGADPLPAAEAEKAVRQWRYRPTLLNGQPVEVVTTIEVDFRLKP